MECGLHPRDMGLTFKSDIIQANGNIATSAIDHIYVSDELEAKTKTIIIIIIILLCFRVIINCRFSIPVLQVK